MKALLRKKGETVTEADGLVFINWTTGAPLTDPRWSGGPYILVNDYAPKDPADDGVTYGCTDPSAASQPAGPTSAAAPAQDPVADTIVIDGVTYIRKSQD